MAALCEDSVTDGVLVKPGAVVDGVEEVVAPVLTQLGCIGAGGHNGLGIHGRSILHQLNEKHMFGCWKTHVDLCWRSLHRDWQGTSTPPTSSFFEFTFEEPELL